MGILKLASEMFFEVIKNKQKNFLTKNFKNLIDF